MTMMDVPQPMMNMVFTDAAAAYYNGGPACGAPRLVFVDKVSKDLLTIQPDSWAYVKVNGPYTCVINLVAKWWTQEREAMRPRLYCNLLTHEYGHLMNI